MNVKQKKCKQCDTMFKTKLKAKIYCSSKCRTIVGVKKWNKKQRKPCPGCGNLMKHTSNLCLPCNNGTTFRKNQTLEDFIKNNSHKDKWAAVKYSQVREFSRMWNKHLKNNPCQNCGYDKHIEFCHIIPISKFPKTALLKEVNAESNIAILCRNCHWEFDHGMLTI